MLELFAASCGGIERWMHGQIEQVSAKIDEKSCPCA
jgi:hypothetical protein